MLRGVVLFILYVSFTANIHAQINLSKGVIRKCLCEGSTVPLGDTCVEHNSSVVHVWIPAIEEGSDFPIEAFGEIVVAPLECPQGSYAASEYGLAVVSVDGKLMPSPEPETDLYCLEYYVDELGNLGQRYEFCLALDPIQLCCPLDQTISDEGKCLPQSPDEPRIKLWPGKFEYTVQNVECTLKQPHEVVKISDHPQTIKKIFGYDNPYSNETCLVAHEFARNVSYYRRSCECDRLACVAFCCPHDMAFDIRTSSCVISNSTYDDRNLIFPETEIKLVDKNLHCENDLVILNFTDDQYSILSDGSLKPSLSAPYPLHSFCLGVVKNGTHEVSTGMACLRDPPLPPCQWRFIVIRIFLVVSSIFILLTLIVYLGVKNLRNRIGGACLISELVALLISQIILVTIQTGQHRFSDAGCLISGVLGIVFILASFFWSNVMCFDVWSTFRVLRPFNEKLLNVKLFAKYSLYAWGLPILVGGIVIAVEVTEANPRPSFVPADGCFFVSSASDLAAQWIYLYGIILVLLCANCAFFVHVGAKLLPLKMEQKKFLNKGNDSAENSHVDLENLKLYAKLFVIMGLPWLLEVFTSFILEAHKCYTWILDIFNLSRGILIFVIFVCKRSTREKIEASWFPNQPQPNASTTSERSRKTSIMSLTTWLPTRKISSQVPPKMEALDEEATQS